ncbi:hypothetical protein BKI52_09670 [marine bacterium AO1-C]|nr:hypothetical protein BKI52_09670 [marine bacterium AO1-C]
MAQYTILQKTAIQAILSRYGIATVTDWKLLEGGSANTNYWISTPEAQLVLTICEAKNAQQTQELAGLLEYLHQAGFSTSKVIRNLSQQLVEFWEGKPVILKEYLIGQVMESLPSHLLESVGQQLGKLHLLAAPDYVPKTIDYGLEAFAEMETYAPNSVFYIWLKEIQQYVSEYNLPNLPKALIHSDLFYNNIIVDAVQSKAIIMDFEEASDYYRVFDLGMTITGVCSQSTEVDLAQVKHLLLGYQQVIQLLDVEIEALQAFIVYAAAATAFWRYRQYHVLNPEPAMQNHYLLMKNLADSVRSLSKTCFTDLF